MIDKRHTCAITGHRPQDLPWDYYKDFSDENVFFEGVVRETLNMLVDKGYCKFITGGALGVDTVFAEAVVNRRREPPPILLELAIPCKSQSDSWDKRDRDRYNALLKEADEVNYISDHYTKYCMMKRNQYMVDHADCLVAFWTGKQFGGTYQTIKYAHKKGLPVVIIDIKDVAKNSKKRD